jgi:hypothetical protein
MNFVPLAGPLTLSALHKLNAHLEGDRLARSDNVLSNC